MPGPCVLIQVFPVTDTTPVRTEMKAHPSKTGLSELSLGLTLWLACLGASQAQSLVELYESARDFDATVREHGRVCLRAGDEQNGMAARACRKAACRRQTRPSV